MKNLLLLLPFCLFTLSSTHAQSYQIPNGRIFTSDGKTIVFKNLAPAEGGYTFQSPTGTTKQDIVNDKIVRIDRQTGTEAGKWALIVGLSGLVGSALGVMQAKAANPGVESVNGTPVIAGLTAASVLIGFAIGAGKKTYSPVYTNPKFQKGTNSGNVSLQLHLDKQQNTAGLSLCYKL